MNSNNAISYSLVALRTAVTIYINMENDVSDDPNPHPTISHFDPLALQHHQLSPNLIFLRLADLANNLGIEYWRTKRFY
jgi:hypothetical protein